MKAELKCRNELWGDGITLLIAHSNYVYRWQGYPIAGLLFTKNPNRIKVCDDYG